MSQQIGLYCNKKSLFSIAKDEFFTSEKLAINYGEKIDFLCYNKWMLTVTKQRLNNVAINGFLMSKKLFNIAKKEHFNVPENRVH